MFEAAGLDNHTLEIALFDISFKQVGLAAQLRSALKIKAHHALSKKKWNSRVLKMIEIVHSLLHYDVLYLGGGNAAHIEVELPDNVRVASNDAGITGGIHLWDAGFGTSSND